MASRYDQLIAAVFRSHYRGAGTRQFEFQRAEVEACAKKLDIVLPKNIGDVIYSFRYRKPLPSAIRETAPERQHWVIEGAGTGRYRFVLRAMANILPREDMLGIRIPDATPQIIAGYALNDEQALLAKLRYNRLVDIFLGLTAYSLQNHLRTSVKGVGQIEIDELYVGVNKHGCQFIIPVQAKGHADKIGVVQTSQDIAFCKQRYPQLICRALAAQFMANEQIALFELAMGGGSIKVIEEKHYELVPKDQISEEDLAAYSKRN
ncbi:MAG: endonuclease [Kiritimatiellaeota bacterium]|nr:endonuclease [Kiritimatiellota bacterium]